MIPSMSTKVKAGVPFLVSSVAKLLALYAENKHHRAWLQTVPNCLVLLLPLPLNINNMRCITFAANRYPLLLERRPFKLFWSSRGGRRSEIPDLAVNATLLTLEDLNVPREAAVKLAGMSFVGSGFCRFLLFLLSCFFCAFGPWVALLTDLQIHKLYMDLKIFLFSVAPICLLTDTPRLVQR